MREPGRRFLDEYVPAHCKASTAAEHRRSVEFFVDPRIGRRPVPDIQRSDIAALHHDMRGTPYQANRTLGVLSKTFNLAELSGCRLSEIQKLRWERVDLGAGELRLPDTKTGAKVVHPGNPAIEVLRGLRRPDDNPWGIAGRKPGSHLTDLQHPWRRIRARAGLADVRLHDLRHSFACGGLLVGEGLPMIGKLLGHTQVQTTARYAHLANDPFEAAANRIASRIADIAG